MVVALLGATVLILRADSTARPVRAVTASGVGELSGCLEFVVPAGARGMSGSTCQHAEYKPQQRHEGDARSADL